jgi:isopentenyldiphosphate isomerase
MMELTQINICGNCNHTNLYSTSHWTNNCSVCGHPLIGVEDQDVDRTRRALEDFMEKIRGGLETVET